MLCLVSSLTHQFLMRWESEIEKRRFRMWKVEFISHSVVAINKVLVYIWHMDGGPKPKLILLFCFFLKCPICFAYAFPLEWEDSSANKLFGPDFRFVESWADAVAVMGFNCIWVKGKASFMCLQGRCRFLFFLGNSVKNLASFFLSLFIFILVHFLIYNNFLRLNYGLHV